MFTDTTGMSAAQAQFYKDRQDEIIARRHGWASFVTWTISCCEPFVTWTICFCHLNHLLWTICHLNHSVNYFLLWTICHLNYLSKPMNYIDNVAISHTTLLLQHRTRFKT
jgi:hypothetical protein